MYWSAHQLCELYSAPFQLQLCQQLRNLAATNFLVDAESLIHTATCQPIFPWEFNVIHYPLRFALLGRVSTEQDLNYLGFLQLWLKRMVWIALFYCRSMPTQCCYPGRTRISQTSLRMVLLSWEANTESWSSKRVWSVSSKVLLLTWPRWTVRWDLQYLNAILHIHKPQMHLLKHQRKHPAYVPKNQHEPYLVNAHIFRLRCSGLLIGRKCSSLFCYNISSSVNVLCNNLLMSICIARCYFVALSSQTRTLLHAPLSYVVQHLSKTNSLYCDFSLWSYCDALNRR